MIVLLIILLIFILIFLIPAGAYVKYEQSGITLSIVAGPVHIQILPKKEKKKKTPKSPKEKKKKKKEKPEKQKKEDKKKPKENQSIGGKVEFFRKLIAIGLSALHCLWHKLRMDQLILSYTIGGKNSSAAGAAMKYGEAWAAIGVIIPTIEKHFNLRERDLNVYLDYTAEEDTIYAEAQITILVGSVFWIAIHYGFKVLKVFISNKMKKRVKGGKKNGTSDQ